MLAIDKCMLIAWNLMSNFLVLRLSSIMISLMHLSMKCRRWGFNCFQKFAIKFPPAHRQIIPVKCNQISPPQAAHCCQSQGRTQERHNKIISPNKTLQSFIIVAALPKIHVPATAAIIHFNHNLRYTA